MYNREENQDVTLERDSNLTNTLITVKKHMKTIEELVNELKKDINENKRFGKIIRSENQTLEHKTKEKCNELAKLMQEDFTNFQRDIKRVKQNDNSESGFFEQQ